MKAEPASAVKQFKIIHKLLEETKNRYLMEYNLTSVQMDVLIYLKHNTGKEIHQREIEKWLGLKNPTVTGILNRLEEKGFIVRRKNESDRRFRMIDLTEKSNQLIAKGYDGMCRVESRIYDSLLEEEREQLSVILTKIIGSLMEQQKE